jgi:hypothetical protein
MDKYVKRNILYLIDNNNNITNLIKTDKITKIYNLYLDYIYIDSDIELIDILNNLDKKKYMILSKVKNKKKYLKILNNKIYNVDNTLIYKFNDNISSYVYVFHQNAYYNGNNNYFDIYKYKYVKYGMYLRQLHLTKKYSTYHLTVQ